MYSLETHESMFKLGMHRALLEDSCKKGFSIKQASDGRIRLGVCSDMVTVPESWVEGAITFVAEGVILRRRKGIFKC
jgi:hypothetical protein